MRALMLWLVLLASVAGIVQAADAVKFSGTVLAVDASSRTITLEEVGIGVGGQNQVIRRRIELTPDTRVVLASRPPAATQGAVAPYVESSIAPADLRIGDFATANVTTEGDRTIATSVVVVRTGGDASPATAGQPAR